MRKVLIACATIILAFASTALSYEANNMLRESVCFATSNEIANRPWNAANLDALRAMDKAAIVKFFNTVEGPGGDWDGQDMGGFAWIDLAGDGKYELLVTQFTRCCGYLTIYWQDAPGKMRGDLYEGAGNFPHMVRDLAGDGKQELILDATIGVDDRRPMSGVWVATWPQVYRLRNGRYVDASHDFANFYDTEVLPELEKNIAALQQDVAGQQGKPKPTPNAEYPMQQAVDIEWFGAGRALAALEMERDKILRVLGRDPEAGVAEAREWAKSPDPELIEDAYVVLGDMHGHEQEYQAAESALFRLEPWRVQMQADALKYPPQAPPTPPQK